MRAGRLDQQITIQTYTKTRGTSGEQVDTWQDWKTVWANVVTSGGSENYYNPQIAAVSSHKILTRFIQRPGLDWPLLRIIWRGKVLDVIHVDESRYRFGEMYWLCSEQVTP